MELCPADVLLACGNCEERKPYTVPMTEAEIEELCNDTEKFADYWLATTQIPQALSAMYTREEISRFSGDAYFLYYNIDGKACRGRVAVFLGKEAERVLATERSKGFTGWSTVDDRVSFAKLLHRGMQECLTKYKEEQV